jgi:hypothetical protein
MKMHRFQQAMAPLRMLQLRCHSRGALIVIALERSFVKGTAASLPWGSTMLATPAS